MSSDQQNKSAVVESHKIAVPIPLTNKPLYDVTEIIKILARIFRDQSVKQSAIIFLGAILLNWISWLRQGCSLSTLVHAKTFVIDRGKDESDASSDTTKISVLRQTINKRINDETHLTRSIYSNIRRKDLDILKFFS
ncbi:hypothetical protein RF11_09567 [Thelohanellus kitauei]|uniref:Uncharacterized protein n=1 Tax=Thelohanellus kitauei TaxID=669202 RepID=A0A0C2IM08_THEKT|nr:hypothetical protein RF11_09567 [Thelohanellus kitauei]